MNGPRKPPAAPAPWRTRRLRQAALFVTLPGLLLGTVSITTAYSAGWLTPPPPPPPCQPEVVPAPDRGSFTVDVLNATGRGGVAADTAAQLGRRGFEIRDIRNAPDSWYVTFPAVVHHGLEGLDAALLVQQQVPGSRLFEDSRSGTSIDLVVGLGFTGLLPLPPRQEPRPGEVTANVYNTTFRTGLAADVAEALGARGFQVKEVTNDPLRTMYAGTAMVRHGAEGDLAARVLARHVPGAVLVKDTRADASVDLVIGNAFAALVPLASVPPPPPRPPRTVPTVARPCD